MLRRISAVLVSITFGTTVGCAPRVNHVHFVIPDGYEGGFCLLPDTGLGAVLKAHQNKYTLIIPTSGVLKITGFDPFRSYKVSASFESGQALEIADKTSQVKNMGLWEMPTHVDNDRNNSYWYFVGTQKSWESLRGFEYKVGSVVAHRNQ